MDDFIKRFESGYRPLVINRAEVEAKLRQHLRALGVCDMPISWASPTVGCDIARRILVQKLRHLSPLDVLSRHDSTDDPDTVISNAAYNPAVRNAGSELNRMLFDALQGKSIKLGTSLLLDLSLLIRGLPEPHSNSFFQWVHRTAWRACQPVPDLVYSAARLGLGEERIWHPLLEAYEAGLFLYWATCTDVICVGVPLDADAPHVDEMGRFHNANGPVAAWPDGDSVHFWHGRLIPRWVIEFKDWLTVQDFRQASPGIDTVILEIKGGTPWLMEQLKGKVRLVQADEHGRLWEAEGADGELWRFVEVEEGTLMPDGTRRSTVFDLTSASAANWWANRHARAALAATYGRLR